MPLPTSRLAAWSDSSQLSLEGWLGHERDNSCLGIRVPNQIVMPNASYLDTPVTDEQIAALDAARGAEDLFLKVMLAGTARIPLPSAKDVEASNKHGVLTKPEYPGDIQSVRIDSGTPTPIKITKQQWVEMLNIVGPRRFRLIELPSAAGSTLAPLSATLEVATLHLRRGDWREAIARAREVVEGVVIEVASCWNVPKPANGSQVKWCEALGKRLANVWPDDSASGTLLGQLMAAAWSWTSEEHHYSPTAVSKRTEAEFALGLATDLLLLAGELMDVHAAFPRVGENENQP